MKIASILLLVLQAQSVAEIEEKIKNAPDKGYEIGVVIGSFLPYLILIGLAYLFYYFARKKRDKE